MQRKKQLIVIGLLVVSFFLLMDLNTRLTVLFRLTRTQNEMQTNVYQLQMTEQWLKTQIAIATSDQALVPFANEDRRWFKEGDIPVFPVQDPRVTPAAQIQPTPTLLVVEHWEKWWALFFGQ